MPTLRVIRSMISGLGCSARDCARLVAEKARTNIIANGASLRLFTSLLLLGICLRLRGLFEATCLFADETSHLISGFGYHSSDIAGNAGVFDGYVFLTQDPLSLLVLERDTNGQHCVVIALLDIPERRYSWRVIIYVALYNERWLRL